MPTEPPDDPIDGFVGLQLDRPHRPAAMRLR